MLNLSRKKGESVVITCTCPNCNHKSRGHIEILETKGSSAKLGFALPQHFFVMRHEIQKMIDLDEKLSQEETLGQAS